MWDACRANTPLAPRFSGIKIDAESFKAHLSEASAQVYLDAFQQAAQDMEPMLSDTQKQVDLWVRLAKQPYDENGVISPFSIKCELKPGEAESSGASGGARARLSQRLVGEFLPAFPLSEAPHRVLSKSLSKLSQLLLSLVGEAFTDRVVQLESENAVLKQKVATPPPPPQPQVIPITISVSLGTPTITYHPPQRR